MRRKIDSLFMGERSVDGAGVKLQRVFGYRDIPKFDPYLMLDFFDSQNPDDYVKGFPWHPHRGIETITYLISGEIEHGDSLGNSGTIRDGSCQWMNAGSGILHQEMPKASPLMLGFQLWLNLPSNEKMSTPTYGDIEASDIPVDKGDTYTLKVIAGEFNGLIGPGGRNCTPKPSIFDVELLPNSVFAISTEPSRTFFAFLLRGEASFEDNGSLVGYPQGVLYGDGNSIEIRAGQGGARFMLVSGDKIGEPIAWGGPIVMNTKEELNLAFDELKSDNFIKVSPNKKS